MTVKITVPAQALEAARFDGAVDGRKTALLTLRSPCGLQAAVCNHGARLLQLFVPAGDCRMLDVALGHDSLQQLLDGMPSMGAFIGRYANRIGGARFPWEGGQWQLPANDGPNCIHGGPMGSRVQVFDVLEQADDHARLGWTFLQAQDGFPCDLRLELRYAVAPPGVLRIEWLARPLRGATVASFTGHAFFNLEGHDSGAVDGHAITLPAGHVLRTDAQRIPTGALLAVEGTPFDFRQPRTVGEAMAADAAAGGSAVGPRSFDHCWVDAALLTGDGGAAVSLPLRHMATAQAPVSGVRMEVWSDAPSLQFYAGGGLDGSLPRHAGKGGVAYGARAGLCLEPQGLPDAPNHPAFPSTLLREGQTQRGRIEYRFSCAAA